MITVWTGDVVQMGGARPLVFLYSTSGAVLTPPAQRGNIDYDQVGADARLGDGAQFQMVGTGTKTAGHVLVYDTQLNAIDGGSPGGGSGITQLTGDGTAGPGSGSQAFTLANNAVTTAKINNSTITLAKIQNAASNSKLVGSSASGSGAAYSEISLGTNLSMSGTTLNASGGSSFPWTIVQERRYTIPAAASSITCTFPKTTASSGNTAFILIACGGPSVPAGWTADFNIVQTNARLMLIHKATASDTSVTFTTGSADGYDVLFFEVAGTHALDASSTGLISGTFSGSVAPAAITVSANAVVFCALCSLTSGGVTISNATMDPKWRHIAPFGGNFNGSRYLTGHMSVVGAAAGSVTPPPIDVLATAFSGGGTAYASFSIL